MSVSPRLGKFRPHVPSKGSSPAVGILNGTESGRSNELEQEMNGQLQITRIDTFPFLLLNENAKPDQWECGVGRGRSSCIKSNRNVSHQAQLCTIVGEVKALSESSNATTRSADQRLPKQYSEFSTNHGRHHSQFSRWLYVRCIACNSRGIKNGSLLAQVRTV